MDKNKGITSVSYNRFNLPKKVEVTNTTHNGVIQYIYDANGTKLKKTANDNGNETIVEYNGNFVYENGSLKSITQPEGYIESNGSGGYQYVYKYRDIWGNTRITYADDNNDQKVVKTEIRREQNYYPFGMQHKGYNSMSYGVKNNLKTYQGQEFTEDLGLNTHEWRYRVSDPATGRFWQIDPLAEKYVYNSTYAFQENKLGSGVELEGLENSSFESRQRYRDKQHIKGNITTDEFIQQGSAEGKGALAGISLITPGPEDVVIGAFVATKFGGAIIRGLSKFADEAARAVKKIFKTSDEGADAVKAGSRTEPKDLQEQLTLDEAKSGQGEKIMQGKLKDGKYDPETGTVDKMGHNHDHGDGTSTEVHYDRNRKTGEGSGYKIKDDTNKNSRGNKNGNSWTTIKDK